MTHRKDHYHFAFPLNDYREIVTDFKAPESFVEKDISYLRRWYKSDGRGHQIRGRECASLDTQRSHYQQRFLYIYVSEISLKAKSLSNLYGIS